jgi:hypothetical protein
MASAQIKLHVNNILQNKMSRLLMTIKFFIMIDYLNKDGEEESVECMTTSGSHLYQN